MFHDKMMPVRACQLGLVNDFSFHYVSNAFSTFYLLLKFHVYGHYALHIALDLCHSSFVVNFHVAVPLPASSKVVGLKT